MTREHGIDIAIIGAGASGLMAAIAASGMRPHSILLLEKEERVGRKLLATGNGRCNLLNMHVDKERYHGNHVDIALSLLDRITPSRVMSRFSEIGLVCREERDGRVYPQSGLASTVLDALRSAVDRSSVRTQCNARVQKIASHRKGFVIHLSDGSHVHARRVIMAAGGKASPAFGADGDAHALLSSLGHAIVPPMPALSPLKLPLDRIRGLKGIRMHATLSLYVESTLVRTEAGEALFTDYGISGIAAMQLSRHAEAALRTGKHAALSISLLDAQAAAEQMRLRTALYAGRTWDTFFTGLLHKNLGIALLREAGIAPSSPVENGNLDGLTRLLYDFRLPILGVLPFKNAQITAGGASLDQFDTNTLESRLVPGLYACGEALDVDGDCGGYNLLWAWVSGIIAGESAAQHHREVST